MNQILSLILILGSLAAQTVSNVQVRQEGLEIIITSAVAAHLEGAAGHIDHAGGK